MFANRLFQTFCPSLEIGTSLLAGISVTFFLVFFSRKPLCLPLLLKRYGAATGAAFFLWVLMLVCGSKISWGSGLSNAPSLLAGILLILACVFLNYYIGNIAGGFRIEILVNLADSKTPLSLEEWMAVYGKGAGMRYFLEDRLRSTLISWNLAIQDGDKITLTPLGRLAGKVNLFFAQLFSEVKK